MHKIALVPESDENAEIDKVEERGLESVTKKRSNSKNIWPLVGFGLFGVAGAGYAMTGFVSTEAPRPLLAKSPETHFTTGYARHDQIPAFQKRLDEERAVTPSEPTIRQAPPVDTGSSTIDALMGRHRMRMESLETSARVKAEGDRAAFDLQRDRVAFERASDAELRLQKRQAAPALVFDVSKDED